MKIKLMVSEERYTEAAKELIEKGFEIDDNADFILCERNVYASYIIGKRDEEIYRLKTTDISHIESFAHDIVAYSEGKEYKINERLKRLTEILDPKDFIRISNSVIISASHIKSIKPAFTQKFIITMSDDSKVDVTRSYYYIFKEFYGI